MTESGKPVPNEIIHASDIYSKQKVVDLINSGINLDLLWTNASPYSAFPEQIISLDLSKYKAIVISACDYGLDETRRDNTQTAFILKNVKSHLFSVYLNQDIGSVRSVLASENSIFFFRGQLMLAVILMTQQQSHKKYGVLCNENFLYIKFRRK